MTHLLTLGLLLLLSITTTWSQDSWVKTFGGSGGEDCYSVTTSDDGILITGYYSSNDGDFEGMNKGNKDIFVIKLDRDGKVLWKKTFGGSGLDKGSSITTTGDGGVLITGRTSSNDGDFQGMNKGFEDIFVIKLDGNGNVLWKKTFGGTSDDRGHAITTTGDGGILITGRTESNDGDFEGMNKGGEDIFVIKLDRDGKVLWKKLFGGSGVDWGTSITTTDGGVLITGLTTSNDGDFEGMNKGDWDIFVIKLDTDGKVLWKKLFGGSKEDMGQSITTTSDGGVLITVVAHSNDGDFKGMNKGGGDILVIKLDRDGKVLWKKTFGGSERDLGSSITTTGDGGILITGRTSSNDGDFQGMNKGFEDIFVMKLDGNGNVLWKKTYGGSGSEDGESITTTSDGGILITGDYRSNDGDFEGMNKGDWDIFIMKLDSNGNLTPTTSVNEQTTTSQLSVSPNPLSTSSTITYTLDNPSPVRIELMNTLGQVIEVVFDGYGESGSHRIPLNVSSLTSGMYYVRLTGETGVQTTQVCVVR
jgi:hypothetical protein